MKLPNRIIYTTLALAAMLLSSIGVHAAQSNFTAKSTLDSTVMLMGSKSLLTVEFSGAIDKTAHTFIIDSLWKDVEIQRATDPEIKSLGGGRSELRQQYIVQGFDSGLYTLPPIYCVSGHDTVATNRPVLKVEPVALDSANVIFKDGEPVDVTVTDYTDVVDDNYKFTDALPDWATNYGWWIVLTIVLIAALIFVYMKWLRHGRIPLMPAKKPVPPYELAMSQLEQLQERKLWQMGAEKEYYTELTDILRTYLSGRFGIDAMEMTTSEILTAIKNDPFVDQFSKQVNDVLSEADFVKFAKAKPQAHENEHAFNLTRQFVEQTRPVASAETSSDETEDGNTNQTPTNEGTTE